MEKDMLPILLVIGLFMLLAYDIAANHGVWYRAAIKFLDDAWRGLR